MLSLRSRDKALAHPYLSELLCGEDGVYDLRKIV